MTSYIQVLTVLTGKVSSRWWQSPHPASDGYQNQSIGTVLWERRYETRYSFCLRLVRKDFVKEKHLYVMGTVGFLVVCWDAEVWEGREGLPGIRTCINQDPGAGQGWPYVWLWPWQYWPGNTEIRHWLPLSSRIRGKSISSSSFAISSKLCTNRLLHFVIRKSNFLKKCILRNMDGKWIESRCWGGAVSVKRKLGRMASDPPLS